MADKQKGGDREVPRTARTDPATTDSREASAALTTMVCITCGNEEFFDAQVPDALQCRRCGGTVFRSFDTPASSNDAAASAAEEQARSMAYGDASPDTSPDEVRDLDAR